MGNDEFLSCPERKKYYEDLVQNLGKAINNLRNSENADFEDEKFLLDNLINLLANKKLGLKTINFKKICTQTRMFLEKNSIKYISERGQNIIYSFNEQEIMVTPQEYDYYSNYNNNENVLKAIFGVLPPLKDYPNKISFEDKNRVKSMANPSIYNGSDFKDLGILNGIDPVDMNNNILNQLISISHLPQLSQISPVPLINSTNIFNQNLGSSHINSLMSRTSDLTHPKPYL